LQALGRQLRAQRKALGVSAVVTSEAAGMSRVTLHRIEQGAPSVTVGAWANVIAALGMQLNLQTTAAGHSKDRPAAGWLPVRVALADYPQLKALAWQVQGTHYLTLIEAHDIYERNARHLDRANMTAQEQALIDALQQALGRGGGDV
jgi:transcriptional regulator with XRE-family HTH domain